MSEDNGNITKGNKEQDNPFSIIPKDRILNLKLSGMSDRAVGKELNLAHSTVNKHYHKELSKQNQHQQKNLENLRFQQYLRYERVYEVCFEQLERKNFRATQWATIATKVLSEQSKLYGLNTGDLNINIDQRNQYINPDRNHPDNVAVREKLAKSMNGFIRQQVSFIICALLLGQEYKNLPEQDKLLKEYIGDIYE